MCTLRKIMIALSAGVDYLHTADMIHGDLKSANVLLKSTGTDARGFTCKVSLLSYSDPEHSLYGGPTLQQPCVRRQSSLRLMGAACTRK